MDAPNVHIHLFESIDEASSIGAKKKKKKKTRVTTGDAKKLVRIEIKGTKIPIKYAKDILVETANWLIKNKKIKPKDAPIDSGPKRYLISHTKFHKAGNPFKASKKLDNGLFIFTSYSEDGCIYKSRFLLKKYGFKDEDLKIIRK